MTKVTVIITKNPDDPHFSKRLAGVLKQDYPKEDLEILLLAYSESGENSCCCGGGWKEEQGIRKIFSEKNTSMAYMRNKAVEQAAGDYILFLDTEDLLMRDYVRKAAACLDSDEKLGLIYGRGERIGEKFGPWLKPFSLTALLLEGVATSCAVLRKSVWKAVGGYHEYSKSGWIDRDFWISVLEKNLQIEALKDTPGYYHRVKIADLLRESEAGQEDDALWEELYSRHRDFFENQPEVFAEAMNDAFHYRRLRYGMSYRIGKPLAKILRILFMPLLPLIHFFRRIQISLRAV